jgi:membrane protease YdiL (CAAX protease family)
VPSPPGVRGIDLVLVTLAIAATMAVGIPAISILIPGNGLTLAAIVASLAIQGVAVLGSVHLLIVRRRALSWRAMGFRPTGRRAVLLAIAAGIALVPLIELTERITGTGTGRLVETMIAPDGFTVTGLAGALVAVGLVAPLCEEIYFRGLLFGWLRQRVGWMAAMPLSALVFGGLHLYYPLPHIAIVAVLGLLFAMAYERTGSLWIPFAIHAAQNLTVAAFVYAAID